MSIPLTLARLRDLTELLDTTQKGNCLDAANAKIKVAAAMDVIKSEVTQIQAVLNGHLGTATNRKLTEINKLVHEVLAECQKEPK